jgi:hypothetical protein
MCVLSEDKVCKCCVARSITHGEKVCKILSQAEKSVPSQVTGAMTEGHVSSGKSRTRTSRPQVPSEASGGSGCTNENGHRCKAGDARWAYSSRSDAHNVQDDDWTLVRRPTRRSRQEAIASSTDTKDPIECLDKTVYGRQPSVRRRLANQYELLCDGWER